MCHEDAAGSIQHVLQGLWCETDKFAFRRDMTAVGAFFLPSMPQR
jgi:hypothetical protein